MILTAQASPRVHPILILALCVYVIALAAAILYAETLAIFALIGAIFFVTFVWHPVLGLYTTTVLLLLSGAGGIVGFVGGTDTLAVTLAKLCGTAALAAWAVNLLARKLPLALNAPVFLLGGFCLWAVFGTLLSPTADQQWPEWVRLITLLGYFLLAINTLNTAQSLRTYILLLLGCGIIMSTVAVLQYIIPAWHTTGTLGATEGAYIDPESLQGDAAIRVSGRAGHSNWLAMILLLILPLNTYWFSMTKSSRIRLFILLGIALELAALVFTFTRTGLLIGSLIFFALLLKSMVRVSPLRLFTFLFALVIAWILLPAPYKERVMTPKQYTQSTSVKSRVELQAAAARYMLENPIVGLGLGGFGINFIRENSKTAHTMKYMVERQGWGDIFIGTHNLFLQIGSDTGIVGLLFFLAFLVTALRGLLHSERRYKTIGDKQGQELASALIISIIGFVFCAVFLHALQQKIWWMLAAAAVALQMYNPEFRDSKELLARDIGEPNDA